MASSSSSSSYSSIVSVYIPCINNVDEKYIVRVFKEKKIGDVARVDFVVNKVKQRREAFVHFDKWYDTDDSIKLREDIVNSDTQTRFIYRANNYWPLLVNKNPMTKYSTARKSNATYDIEEQLEAIQNKVASLTFMSNVHDANIRFLLKRTANQGSGSRSGFGSGFGTGTGFGTVTGFGSDSSEIKRQRIAMGEGCDTSHTCHNLTEAWQPSQSSE